MTHRPWKKGDRLYNAEMEIYANVTSTDKYKDGSGVIVLHTDGGMVGSGTQEAFASEWKLLEQTPNPNR
jgi:hypothetical protein